MVLDSPCYFQLIYMIYGEGWGVVHTFISFGLTYTIEWFSILFATIKYKSADYLEEKDIAQFPRPVHHRIPNFVGADDAAKLFATLPEFKSAAIAFHRRYVCSSNPFNNCAGSAANAAVYY